MTITPFSFNGSEVRTITKDGEPWFVAADVCRVLEISNSRDAVSSLDDDEKGVATTDTLGGAQSLNIISESGLYALTFKSRKPEAKAFKKWVTAEVLPAIRKTGSYINHPSALRLLADKIEENEKLRLTVAQQQPAVEYVERFVKAEGLFGIRETAKILGLQQNAFISMCIERKVLFRENGSLQPYAQWLDAGHFAIKTGEANDHAFKQTRFTSRGVEWVRRYIRVAELIGETSAIAA
jgi:anti-repressor protein